jgi:protein-ribulosamine 3-kinase
MARRDNRIGKFNGAILSCEDAQLKRSMPGELMGTREEFSRSVAIEIGKAMGTTLQFEPAARVHGGSINDCYRWESDAGPLFVKVAGVEKHAAFAAEAAGLDELKRANAVRVPMVLSVGANAVNCWIALEWIRFGARSRAVDSAFGEALARQHRVTAEAFGWHRDNTIGNTPQLNGWLSDWVRFFQERRLGYQLELAARNGHGGRLQERGAALLNRVGEFFQTYRPQPGLLHGDLWGGNWAADEEGRPVIFDPAVYYGDREADVAMTRLFGGFGADFYSAYEAGSQVDPGAPVRVELYNLYHVLNHLNLFGEGYLGQALAMIDGLMAQLGH